MRYEVDGADLCIRISITAIAQQAMASTIVARVTSYRDLAMSVGRELCECVTVGEEFYLSGPLDDALGRVIESADPSLQYKDEDETV